MTNGTVWTILIGIYIVAVSGCLVGFLAVIWNVATAGRLRSSLWMGWGAIAIGSLLFIGWLKTGERFSFWMFIPILSLGTGLIAVIQYYVFRLRRRRGRRGRCVYRLKRRCLSTRLRLTA